MKLAHDCFGISRFHENKCTNAVSVRFFSSPIARALISLSIPGNGVEAKHPHYRKGTCNVPVAIRTDRSFAAAFLRGFASGDGSVYANKKYSILRVEITCYYPHLRTHLAECLATLDIQCRLTGRAVLITGFDNCKRFLSVSGFLDESLVSDSNSPKFGIAKNSLASLEFPAKLSI
ncbi:MAG: hypothetical protein HYY37_06850 [Candidatus Aenigmarchaeota archaeon]|nr:hypothetical protein [Candidatus Aenigmarchaeota archaeon]